MEIPAISQIKGKHIFLAPLDWGMGHATRSAAIVDALRKNNRILIGSSPDQIEFFKRLFPEIAQVPLPAYNVHYARRRPVWLSVFCQLPKFFNVIVQEKRALRQVIKNHNIDFVISDNRYGLYDSEVFSVIISHQLRLKLPYFARILNRIHQSRMEKFSEVWVPDFEEPERRLSGELSDAKNFKVPVKYLGPLSALSSSLTADTFYSSELLLLLSGPEPQRSVFEDILLKKLKGSRKKITLIRGCEKKLSTHPDSVKVINMAYGEELAKWINGAERIVCRSGYSTLMDLYLCGKKNLVLVPTPGQPEQEYLAKYWSEKFSVIYCNQENLNEITF